MVLVVAAAVPEGREGLTLRGEGGEGEEVDQRLEVNESSGAV